MKNKITAKLLEMGVKASYRGFPVVVRCLEIALTLDYVRITKDIYPKVATEMGVKPNVVESRFRRTLTRSNIELSNLEFIYDFLVKFRLENT